VAYITSRPARVNIASSHPANNAVLNCLASLGRLGRLKLVISAPHHAADIFARG